MKILYGNKTFDNTSNTSLKDYFRFSLIAVLIAILINKYGIISAFVPTGSMIPTLNIGDKLLVSKMYNLENIKRGDIVVFYSQENEEYMVKRLIGIPGDVISIDNGYVTVNEKKLKEDYVINRDNYTGRYRVPEGKYFFLGDNRQKSFDSRLWENSYIDKDDIVGVVKFRIYPFNSIGSIK